jgi:hypothetical protein
MVFRGRVLDVIEMDKVTQVIVQNKKDGVYFPICFTAFDKLKKEIQNLVVEKKDIVKIEYYLRSKKWEDRYSTTAIIDSIKITEKRPLQFSFDMETGEIFE